LRHLSCISSNIVIVFNGIRETYEIKMPPDNGQEANQMFSQRNNPYCELILNCRIQSYKTVMI
jgi:hypothetical protein